MDRLPKLSPKMIELLLDVDSGRVFARRDRPEHWFRAADDDQDEDKTFSLATSRAAVRHRLTRLVFHNQHTWSVWPTDLGERALDRHKARQQAK